MKRLRSAPVPSLSKDIYQGAASPGMGIVPSFGAPLIVSPLDIANCTLWLDSTDNAQITNVAGKCSQIVDKSPTAAVFTQGTAGNQPVINASGINGRQTLDFLSAASREMDSTTALTPVITTTAYTMFYAANYTGAVATNANSWVNALVLGDLGSLWGMFVSTTAGIGFNWTGADISVRPAQTGGTPFMFTMQLSAGTLSGQVGTGIPVTAACGALTSTAGVMRFGGGNGGGNFFTGPIGEVIGYNRALSGAEIAQVQAYLRARWGT